MKVTSAKRWCLTADKTRAVPEGDPAGAFLLVGEGGEIDAAELEQYGLLPDGSGFVEAPAVETETPEAAIPRARPRKHQS